MVPTAWITFGLISYKIIHETSLKKPKFLVTFLKTPQTSNTNNFAIESNNKHQDCKKKKSFPET